METVELEISTVDDVIEVNKKKHDSDVSTNKEEDITMDTMMYRQS